MSDQPHPGGNPDISPETRNLLLHRARTLNRELVVHLYATEQELSTGQHETVLGALVLADIQLQHLRAVVRVLET